MSTLTQTSAWRALQTHASAMRSTTLARLLAEDPGRADRCITRGAGIKLDWSRQKVTAETLVLLARLAEQQDWSGWRDRMLAGEVVNTTENRPALHVALRRGLAAPAEADAHIASAPVEENIPALMALFGIWHINFNGCQTHAVLPYAQPLAQVPAYLQQLEMESNGKSVNRAGEPIDYATAPVLWGAAGTVGQHSFHQLLHQGRGRRFRY